MKWHTKRFTSTNAQVPSTFGLYAIGYFSEVSGLTTAIHIVYIGQAINLKRRLTQHNPWIDTNPGLEEFLRRNRANLRIWYTTDLSFQALNDTEKEMIRTVKPQFNRRKYSKKDPKT